MATKRQVVGTAPPIGLVGFVDFDELTLQITGFGVENPQGHDVQLRFTNTVTGAVEMEFVERAARQQVAVIARPVFMESYVEDGQTFYRVPSMWSMQWGVSQ